MLLWFGFLRESCPIMSFSIYGSINLRENSTTWPQRSRISWQRKLGFEMHGKTMEVTARAPGKIILSGEHAVVHGSTAVAASINLYTNVTVSIPTAGKFVIIRSLMAPHFCVLVCLLFWTFWFWRAEYVYHAKILWAYFELGIFEMLIERYPVEILGLCILSFLCFAFNVF